MKKVMAKLMFMFMFVVSIFVGKANTISAADVFPSMEQTNMNIKGAEGTEVYELGVEIGEITHTYYVVNNFESATLLLDYVRNNDFYPHADIQWESNISLVLCRTNDTCDAVDVVNVNIEGRGLLNGEGFKLPLNLFTKDADQSLIKEKTTGVDSYILNGTNLGKLLSHYGNVVAGTSKYITMYLVISYESKATYEEGFWWFKEPVTETYSQYSEVIPIINLSAIGGGVSITSENKDNQHKAQVIASVPLKTVKYITTTKVYDIEKDIEKVASDKGKLLSVYFDELGSEEGNTLTTVNVEGIKARTATTPNRLKREFVCELSVDNVENTNYYVYAEDELGNKTIYNIKVPGTSTPVTGGGENKPTEPSAPNTQVGETILIILISVFVLSAALVIFQRIIDYRRKLY